MRTIDDRYHLQGHFRPKGADRDKPIPEIKFKLKRKLRRMLNRSLDRFVLLFLFVLIIPISLSAIDTPCPPNYHRQYSGYYDSNNQFHQTFTCVPDTPEYSCGNECTNLGMTRGTVEFDMCLELCMNRSRIIE